MKLGRVTAVLGGTFDPPHVGHLKAIEGLIRECGVARVLVLPTPAPPHKPSTASVDQRIEMATIAFGALGPDVLLDWREYERAKRQATGQPIYTFDTLLELRREHRELAFVVGSDQLEKLPSWRRFPELLSLSHWIVLERKPRGHEKALSVLQEWAASGLVRRGPRSDEPAWDIRVPLPVEAGGPLRSPPQLWLVPTPAPEVSSTSLREQMALRGQVDASALPPGIEAYLKANHLYGMGAS